jgi:hypothetical protein
MDLARLARMSRRRRRRHERRQKHGRAWGVLRSALVELVSVFLLCVVSFFALFGSRRSTARISPWKSGPSTCRKLQKTYPSSNSTPQPGHQAAGQDGRPHLREVQVGRGDDE